MIALSCRRFRWKLSLFLLPLTLSVPAVSGQTPSVDQVLSSIRSSEQQHLPEAQQGSLWARLALEYQTFANFPKAEDAYNRALHLLKTEPSARAEYASTLDNLSTLYMSYNRVDDAESTIKQALAEQKKLGNRSDIGVTQVHLADIALVRHQFKKAGQLAQQGLQGMESSPDPPKAGLLSAFITVVYARCSRGHCGDGLRDAEQAVAFANEKFGPQSAAAGFALETLGFAKWKTGASQEGENAMLRGIEVLKATLASDDPRLAGAMLQYRTYLLKANRRAEAQDIQQQVTRMTRQAGIYCSGCAVNVNSLSNGMR
jgi:tetratricopeptide (TPR) repeat protein